MAEDRPPPLGGLVVVTGYGDERLGYLAALLSETLNRGLWVSAPDSHQSERELQRARAHLVAGTSVIQVADTRLQARQFRSLAEDLEAPFLLVAVAPPPGSGEEARLPAESEAHGPSRVVVKAGSSLTTQLDVVLAAWNRAKDDLS